MTIYGTPGREGQANVNSRVIVVFEKLPDRRDMPLQERHRLLDGDIREAMARAARRVDDKARQYSVSGYTWDLNDIVYDIARISDEGIESREAVPTVVATLRIGRDGA